MGTVLRGHDTDLGRDLVTKFCWIIIKISRESFSDLSKKCRLLVNCSISNHERIKHLSINWLVSLSRNQSISYGVQLRQASIT